MTGALLLLMLVVLLLNAPFAFMLGSRPDVIARITSEPRAMIPVVSVVGVLFGLFASFTSADVNQRATSLQLATDREINAARSLINLTIGIGPSATPVREAVMEYLQTVVSAERKWLEAGSRVSPPADAPVHSLSLTATVFSEQARASAVVKSLMMSRVEELISARTERLTRSIRRSEIPLWISLTLMAVVTQVVGAIAFAGLRMQAVVFLTGYTLVSVVALAYLGWADRLIGPSRISEQTALFKSLLAQFNSL